MEDFDYTLTDTIVDRLDAYMEEADQCANEMSGYMYDVCEALERSRVLFNTEKLQALYGKSSGVKKLTWANDGAGEVWLKNGSRIGVELFYTYLRYCEISLAGMEPMGSEERG